MSLQIASLTGGYTQIPVIKDISFEVKKGELVGLIGLNGAGKSTIVKHVIGLMQPFKGDISLDGISLAQDPQNYLKRIAYIPEVPILYRELTLKEHIQVTGLAYDLSDEEIKERAQPLIQLFRLEKYLDWFPYDFSKGMKQKVMLVCALMLKSELLVIDEPFIGLDPIAIADLEQILLSILDDGRSVLMTTHVLANAEKLCDSFIFLSEGEIITKGTLAEMNKDLQLEASSLEEFYLAMAKKVVR